MNGLKILCPSILNLPIEGIKEQIVEINESGIDIFHVDIMDGMFVPNFGMSIREIELIRSVTSLPIDCHMMVMHPGRYIKRVADAGCDIIYIHPESELIPTETIDQIRALGKQPGIVINPGISVATVQEMLPIVDYVMIMGVNPGYAGRDFMDYVVPKCKELSVLRTEKNYRYKLVLDGGATAEVIANLYHNCGIEGFVLGKQVFFFQNKPYKECVDYVRSL